MESLTVNPGEAAKMLGIAPATAYKLVKTGEIPSIRLGGRWLVPIASIHHMLAKAEGGNE